MVHQPKIFREMKNGVFVAGGVAEDYKQNYAR